MRFDKDLFISYAHLDNKPLSAEQAGWVTRFHETLESLLSTRMGGKARIWRDKKLTGNDVFADEILQQFPTTALLVSVLSPCYIDSKWCKDELNAFCEAAESSGGLQIGNKSRVFKVIKLPIETDDEVPEPMRNMLGYEFFTFDDEAPIELDPDSQRLAQDYKRRVAKLAWDVSQLIKMLQEKKQAEEGAVQAEPKATKATVYLAQCSYDLRESREKLETELKAHGYSVVPDRTLPSDEEHFVAEVDRLLQQSQLSIHLVGNSYGMVPDGPSGKSVTVLQNERAITQSRENGLRRCIWLPEGTQSEQEQQRDFIEALHKDGDLQFGADLITGDLESLKGSVHQALRPQRVHETGTETAVADGKPLVYLICDERDRKSTIPTRKYLKATGYDVEIPAFEGDASQVREANQKLLATCDAVLVYYGAGDEAWKRTVDSDLKKMNGYRNGPPLRAGYTILAEPSTSDKEELLELEEPNLIDQLSGFSEDGMAPFVTAVADGEDEPR